MRAIKKAMLALSLLAVMASPVFCDPFGPVASAEQSGETPVAIHS